MDDAVWLTRLSQRSSRVRWFTVSNAMRYDGGYAVGDPSAAMRGGFCVLCQCESGSGASLGAHAFMRSDRQVGFSGTLLFQFVFPDVLTHGSGIYVQRRCGD